VYLPITFAGETRMLPPQPGDEKVFDAYHAHLTQVRACLVHTKANMMCHLYA
jgi:hypothetical protein